MNILARADQAATQNDLILALLSERPGEWVPMPDLARAAGCYAVHSRVSNLRASGHHVECKIERAGRLKHSFYRLIPAGVPFQPELSF